MRGRLPGDWLLWAICCANCLTAFQGRCPGPSHTQQLRSSGAGMGHNAWEMSVVHTPTSCWADGWLQVGRHRECSSALLADKCHRCSYRGQSQLLRSHLCLCNSRSYCEFQPSRRWRIESPLAAQLVSLTKHLSLAGRQDGRSKAGSYYSEPSQFKCICQQLRALDLCRG